MDRNNRRRPACWRFPLILAALSLFTASHAEPTTNVARISEGGFTPPTRPSIPEARPMMSAAVSLDALAGGSRELLLSYPGPVHLGDHHEPDCTPPEVMGTTLEIPFVVPYPVDYATVSLEASGVSPLPELADHVYVNGTYIGTLSSGVDQCNTYDTVFTEECGSLLVIGVNSLVIQSGCSPTNVARISEGAITPPIRPSIPEDLPMTSSAGLLNAVAGRSHELVVSYPGPVHLGDHAEPGCTPPEVMGTTLEIPFIVPYSVDAATVSLEASGVSPDPELADHVYVNGTYIGTLSSGVDQCDTYDTFFTGECDSLLVIGENSLVIQSGCSPTNCDDFWPRNITVQVAPSSPNCDDMWLRNIVLIGTPEPAYEIISAEFDQQIYQNGEDTAWLTVWIRSNWGQSENLGVWAELSPQLGQSYYTDTYHFDLDPGEEYVCAVSWPVAKYGASWEFDANVTLQDGSLVVATLPIDHAFMGRVLSEEEVGYGHELLETCYLETPEEQCQVAALGVIPFGSSVSHMLRYVDQMCVAGQLARNGRAGEASMYFISGLGEFARIWLSGVPLDAWAGETLGTIYSQVSLYGSAYGVSQACKEVDIFETFFGAGVPRTEGAFVDSMLFGLSTAWDEAAGDLSAALVIEGAGRARVEADSTWADADSTGLTCTSIARIGSAATITTIGTKARRFLADSLANPHSYSRVEFQSDQGQVLHVGLAHREIGGTSSFLRYPAFNVTGSTIFTVVMADSISVPMLEVDLDGNGTIDFLWHPGAAGVEEDMSPPRPLSPILSLATAPNPTTGSTVLILQSAAALKSVSLSVYDVVGREVRGLAVGDFAAGTHQVIWDGRTRQGQQVASGIYYCMATCAVGGTATNRLVVLR